MNMNKDITKEIYKEVINTYRKYLENLLKKIPDEYINKIMVCNVNSEDPNILQKTSIILDNIIVGEVEINYDGTHINVTYCLKKEWLNDI